MANKLTAFIIAGTFSLIFICAGTSNAQLRKAVSAAETNGTFRNYFEGKSKGAVNEIKILSTGKGKLRVSFNLIYPDINGGGGGNLGTADGEAVIVGDTATFAPADFDQCKITIKFVRPGQIKVTQKGNDSECGFGANVSASGTYKRVSAAKPKFKASE